MTIQNKECKNCGDKGYGFNHGVLVCLSCGEPKTKYGREKLKDMGIIK